MEEKYPLVKCDLGIYHTIWYGGVEVYMHNRFTGKEIEVFTMPDKEDNMEYTSNEVVNFMRRRLREHIDMLPVVQ